MSGLQSCERVLQVARLCEAHDVGHVINNAYGVQSSALCKLARLCHYLLFAHSLHSAHSMSDTASCAITYFIRFGSHILTHDAVLQLCVNMPVCIRLYTLLQ